MRASHCSQQVFIPPALQAASDGDTVSVRSGVYSGGTITKGIALIAEAGANVSVRPTASGESLVVKGLSRTQHCVIQDVSHAFTFNNLDSSPLLDSSTH